MESAHGWIRLQVMAALGIVSLVVGYSVAQAPAPPKVSSFAPANDLVAQVDYFIARIDEATASEADYTETKQLKVGKDANTLVVLALTLALHDEDHKLKAAAPGLLTASQQLSKATATYAGAKAGLDAVKAALAGSGTGTAPTKWENVASMDQLMKQVPLLNSTLKRGALPARFKANAEVNAGLAATLAAIGQVAMADTHEVKNPADLSKWYAYCAEFRDAAGAVNAAIHAGDPAGTAKGMKRMTAACDTCHATFRPEAEE